MGSYEFSGPGDVTRVTGSNTTPASEAANAIAEYTEDHKQYNLRDGFGGEFDAVDPLGPNAHGFGLDLEPESGYIGQPDGEPFPR